MDTGDVILDSAKMTYIPSVIKVMGTLVTLLKSAISIRLYLHPSSTFKIKPVLIR